MYIYISQTQQRLISHNLTLTSVKFLVEIEQLITNYHEDGPNESAFCNVSQGNTIWGQI